MKSNLVWVQFINEIAASERIAFSDAWRLGAQRKPALHSIMLAVGANAQAVQMCNEREARRAGAADRVEKRADFLHRVHAYMDEFKVSYDRAYSTCQTRYPEIFRATFANVASPTNPLPDEPTLNPTLNPNGVFSLPSDTPDEVYQVAYRANGSKLLPVHFGKVVDGLVEFFQDRDKLSHDAAIDFVKRKFSQLWIKMEALASPTK